MMKSIISVFLLCWATFLGFQLQASGTLDSLARPSLEWQIDDYQYASFCEEGFIEVTVVNNFFNANGGLSHAYNIAVEAGWSKAAPHHIPLENECLPLTDFEIAGQSISYETRADTGYLLNISDLEVGISETLGLEDLDGDGQMNDLALGQTFTLRVSQSILPECLYSSCNPSSLGPKYFRLRFHYENSCGVPITKNQAFNTYKYGLGEQANSDDLESSYQIGDTVNLRLVLSRQLHGFNVACPDKISELDLVLPPSLQLLPNAEPTLFGLPLDFEVLEDTLRISGSFNIGYYDIPLFVVCDESSEGTTNLCLSADEDVPLYQIEYHLRQFCEADCLLSIPLFCGTTKSFSVNCLSPEQEGVEGIFTTDFTATRTTLGWTDESLSQKVSTTASNLRLDHALPYDTILLKTEGQIVGDLDFEEIQLLIDHHYLANYDTSHFTFLNADITYFDPISQQSMACSLPLRDTFLMDKFHQMVFDIKALFETGACFENLALTNSGRFSVEMEVIIHEDLPSGLNKLPHLISKFQFQSNGESYHCSFQEANLSLVGYRFRVRAYSFPELILACDTIRFNSGFAQGSGTFHNEDYFPYEYRPLMEVETVLFEAINNFEYLPGSAVLVYSYRPNNAPSGIIDIVRIPIADPIVEAGDTIRYIFQNDGTWPIADFIREQSFYYIEFKATPTCFIPSYNNGFIATTYGQHFRYSDNPDLMTVGGLQDAYLMEYYPLFTSSFESLQTEAIAETEFIQWEIEKCNLSDTEWVTDDMYYNWIGFETMNNSIEIISLQETTPNSPQDLFQPEFYKNDSAQWVQIGTIELETCRTFEVTAKWKNCDIDTVLMQTGYSCRGYPVNPEEGYAPSGYNCNYGIKRDTFAFISPIFSAEAELLQNVSCQGFSDAVAQVTTNISLSNLTYEWQNGNSLTAEIEGLAAGDYEITITSPQSCQTTTNISITEPDELLTSTEILSNYNGFSVSCETSQDGAVEVIAQGGLPPYQYQWSNGATTSVNEQLATGMQSITITDANGCENIANFLLEAPPVFEVSYTSTGVMCADNPDGTASIEVQGGVPDYHFEWPNGATTSTASGLTGGSHFVQISDANNCTTAFEIIIDSPPLLETHLHTSNCCGGNSAHAKLTPYGGTPPFQINWSSGHIGETATFLEAGDYAVTIQEANGCQTIETFQIENIPPLGIELININEESISGANDGSIDVSVTGGGCDYIFEWYRNDEIEPFAFTEDIDNLDGGLYRLFVTVGNSCSSSIEFILGTMVSTHNLNTLEFFKIFPNPTQQDLFIEATFSKKQQGNLKLYNALGQVFYEKKWVESRLNEVLDVRPYPTGIYWLVLETEEGKIVERILIK